MSSKDGLQDRSFLMVNDEADYYNVTVNFVLKKGGSAAVVPPQEPPSQPALTQIPLGVSPSIMKDIQLLFPGGLTEPMPKDLARVELATESSSSYEAAASLDISSQESNKEIAESEHYQSRIA